MHFGCKNLTWIDLLDYMQEFQSPHFPLIECGLILSEEMTNGLVHPGSHFQNLGSLHKR